MNGSRFARFMKRITKSDRLIFKFFFSLLAIVYILIFIYEAVTWDGNYVSIIVALLDGLMIVFILTGILTLYYHHKRYIVSPKKIITWFIFSALVIALIVTILTYIIANSTTYLDPYYELGDFNNIFSYRFLRIFLLLFIVILIGEFFIILMSFGVLGVLTSVERGVGPETMLFITRVTTNTKPSMKQKDKKLYWRYQILRLRFNIPTRVDSKRLNIKQFIPLKNYPWKQYYLAVIWEIIFGSIIGINISLNALLLNSVSITELIAVASFTGAFIQILIFPYLFYNRIDAQIKDSKKDFYLETGLRNRTLQVLSLVGIFAFLFRLIIKDLNVYNIIQSFLVFIIVYIIVAIILTFLYYNYFEEDIAKDIVKRYNEIKE